MSRPTACRTTPLPGQRAAPVTSATTRDRARASARNLFDASQSRWTGAQVVETFTDRAFYARPAGDPSGSGFVDVWCQDNSSTNILQLASAHTTASGTWQEDGFISNGAAYLSSPDVRIVMTTTGDALVVWPQPAASGESNSAYWNRRTSSGWQTPQLLEQSTDGVSSIAICASPVGGALAIHTRWSSNGSYALLGRRWNGTSWSTEETLASATSYMSYLGCAGDASGDFYAAWYSDELSSVQVRRYAAGSGMWESPVTFASDGAYVTVRVTSTGTPHLVWWAYDGLHNGTYWTMLDPNSGAWTSPAYLAISDPSALELDGHGNAFLLYGDDSAASLLWRYLPSGSATWTEPRRIANATDYVFSYSLIVDSEGRAVAMYNHGPGNGTSEIAYNRFQ